MGTYRCQRHVQVHHERDGSGFHLRGTKSSVQHRCRCQIGPHTACRRVCSAGTEGHKARGTGHGAQRNTRQHVTYNNGLPRKRGQRSTAVTPRQSPAMWYPPFHDANNCVDGRRPRETPPAGRTGATEDGMLPAPHTLPRPPPPRPHLPAVARYLDSPTAATGTSWLLMGHWSSHCRRGRRGPLERARGRHTCYTMSTLQMITVPRGVPSSPCTPEQLGFFYNVTS